MTDLFTQQIKCLEKILAGQKVFREFFFDEETFDIKKDFDLAGCGDSKIELLAMCLNTTQTEYTLKLLSRASPTIINLLNPLNDLDVKDLQEFEFLKSSKKTNEDYMKFLKMKEELIERLANYTGKAKEFREKLEKC